MEKKVFLNRAIVLNNQVIEDLSKMGFSILDRRENKNQLQKIALEEDNSLIIQAYIHNNIALFHFFAEVIIQTFEKTTQLIVLLQENAKSGDKKEEILNLISAVDDLLCSDETRMDQFQLEMLQLRQLLYDIHQVVTDDSSSTFIVQHLEDPLHDLVNDCKILYNSVEKIHFLDKKLSDYNSITGATQRSNQQWN